MGGYAHRGLAPNIRGLAGGLAGGLAPGWQGVGRGLEAVQYHLANPAIEPSLAF